MEMNVIHLSTFSFNQLCRICLGIADINVFQIEFEDTQLVEIFETCTTIQMNENDHLPPKICKGCMEEVLKFYKFRQKCLDTHEILLQAAATRERKPKENMLEEKLQRDYEYENSFEGESDNSSEDEDFTDKRTAKSAKHTNRNHCHLCNITFESRKELQLHRKSPDHPRSPKAPCPICSKRCNVKHIQQHIRTHSKEKPHVCAVCKKGFSIKFNLERHQMIHTGEKPFQCEICQKGFIQLKAKQEHMRLHTGETPYVCNECGKQFRVQVSFKVHMRRHSSARQPRDLNRAKPERKHECPVCHKLYTTKVVLKTHMISHGEHKQFLCSQCGKSFFYKAGYMIHLRLHQGLRPHGCNACGKQFTQLGSLKRHELIHRGEKPHVCDICKSAFTQKTHLKYHMQQIHIKEKPFVCTHCGKAFALKGSLTVHVRTHTGETPYVCETCGKGFYDSSNLKKHKRRQHERVERYGREQETDAMIVDALALPTDD